MALPGTACITAEDVGDEMTTTIRAFELGFAMGRHDRRFTVKAAAQEFFMSLSGAYRLLARASGSRKVAMIEEDGEWFVPREIDATDWPF